MARARSPNRDKAFDIYKEYDGNITNREIATMLNEDEKVIAVWKSRDKWNKKINVVQQSNESCTTKENGRNNRLKTSEKAKSRLSKPSYPLQARPGNKNAVTTGEFESIIFDSLDDDELELVENTPIDKIDLLKQEIQLLTVRERRMLKRIEILKEKEMTLVSTKSGVEKGMDTELNEYEATLGQIQSIEEALTRVQDKKQKAIDSLHKFEIDEQKLELTVMKLELEIMKQGVQDDEVEDDGFIGALEAQVGDAWDD
ncbi:terminase [Paraclostridium sordellii 8483]|uniref:phage terminase small subunit n=1 Tax=Paraclostridium sordellii TaxID=1505 RepID=UPI00102F1331|nr:phage terminase small subunit [Paeniclostridium sordellii]TAN63769.1 terminase [Paeniclostridium sordellii 8483]